MTNTVIDQAILEKKQIVFNYTKYSGETSSRRVSNIRYCNDYGDFGYQNDHIKGYCHLRNEERVFKINRMSNLRIYNSSDSIKPKEGCYIATMVYGDYNHPKVFILRNFRDQKLSTTVFGKLFIKIYYGVSPFFVKVFSNSRKVNALIRRMLDYLIFHL